MTTSPVERTRRPAVSVSDGEVLPRPSSSSYGSTVATAAEASNRTAAANRNLSDQEVLCLVTETAEDRAAPSATAADAACGVERTGMMVSRSMGRSEERSDRAERQAEREDWRAETVSEGLD
ncbi:unnamed protein product [Musa acuminata subsp. burmannicoides]